jgi:hypothetical protein
VQGLDQRQCLRIAPLAAQAREKAHVWVGLPYCIDSLKLSINWLDVMGSSLPHHGSPLRNRGSKMLFVCAVVLAVITANVVTILLAANIASRRMHRD